MLKMYNAEVLSKFPVVQHFPFGSLFSWEQDPEATLQKTTVHASSQPTRTDTTARVQPQETAKPSSTQMPTQAPWAKQQDPPSKSGTTAPWAQSSQGPSRSVPTTRAPWAAQSIDVPNASVLPSRAPDGLIRAPWAKKE